LTFDVASIKVAPPGGRSFGTKGGPGTPDPERITYTNLTLQGLLRDAYKVQQVIGPGWLEQERFDIIAKVPKGTKSPQVRQMLQTLLKERFRVVAHTESREFSVYELVVGKNGFKLKESAQDPKSAAGQPAEDGSAGFEIIDGKHVRATFSKEPIGILLAYLGGSEDRPVLDKTGLTGRYDFTLEYAPDGSPAEVSGSFPTFRSAIEQLGLKLQPSKAQLDVLIVESAERTPTPN